MTDGWEVPQIPPVLAPLNKTITFINQLDPASWAKPVTEADKRRAKALGSKKRDIVETALIRMNREMTLLENFCIINYTGFVKILKKHDKVRTDRQGMGCGLLLLLLLLLLLPLPFGVCFAVGV